MTIEKSRTGYAVVFEKSRTGYSAHVPDLLGCVAADHTLERTRKLLNSAIVFHQRGMRNDGQHPPRPRSLETLRRKRLIP